MKNEYITIGKLVATFGLTGELILKHSLGKKSSLKNIKACFIQTSGSYLPYFIEKTKIKSEEETIVKLEGVNTKEEATKFIKKTVWLTEEDFARSVSKKSYAGLLGYKIFNVKDEVGIVSEVIEQPHQVLLKTIVNSKEVFIPLHTETILNVNNAKREIYVQLPEGLLEIYLA